MSRPPSWRQQSCKSQVVYYEAVNLPQIRTVTGEPTCASPNAKRDTPNNLNNAPNPASLTQSAPYYIFRNPHIPPRPTSLPVCLGATSTTTLKTTRITLLEQTLTTSLTTPTARNITTTTTSTLTTTTSATATTNPCPIIPATNSQTDYTANYTLYSRTCGRTLSYANPGNTNPPVTLPIKAKVLACEAAAQCATAALNQGAGYLSFDLHYVFASGWECVLFYGRNTKAEYWDVVDEGVGEGYGYST